MNLLKPKKLRPGQLIGLIAPAGPILPRDRIQRAVTYLEQQGYPVVLGRHVEDQHGYFAGQDEARLNDLNAMLRNPQVRMIMALRGGYGCMRLLGSVDYRSVRRDPKILVGFSDLTALQMALYCRTKLVTFAGPMAAVEFSVPPDPLTEEHFWKAVTTTRRLGKIPTPEIVHCCGSKAVEGVLLGGNLTTLASLVGTPFLPKFKEAILVLEEIDERPYRIDRMLSQLRLAGVLKALRGLVLGQFTQCENTDATRPSLSCEEVLQEFSTALAVPTLTGLLHGHVARKMTLPWGVKARLRTASCQLEVLESALID